MHKRRANELMSTIQRRFPTIICDIRIDRMAPYSLFKLCYLGKIAVTILTRSFDHFNPVLNHFNPLHDHFNPHYIIYI